MKTIVYITSLFFIVWAGCSNQHNVDTDNSGLSPNDREFLNQAAYSSLSEIEGGKFASSRATNDDIRIFGRNMQQDHKGAYDELTSLAKTMDVQIPTEPDPEHKSTQQHLETLTDAAFDAAYMDNQLIDHQKIIDLYESEARNGSDQRLKSYAQKYVMLFRMHQEKAKSLVPPNDSIN